MQAATRRAFGIFVILMAALLAAGPRALAGYIPPASDPACAYCEGRNNNHSSSCPYSSGGGSSSSSDDAPPGDITRAPIVSMPAGMIGGVFMGGGWYFTEMAGKRPNKNFLSSYHDFMTIASGDPVFDGPFNAGAHVGGLPWLALFIPTYPVRQAVVGVAHIITKPRPPKPPDPRIGVYNVIADNYAQLTKGTDAELAKAAADVQAAEWRRTQYLDQFISDHTDLRALRDKDGVEAARARAQKRLDAWSQSRVEKRKLLAGVSAGIREKDAICQAAIDKAGTLGFASELYLYREDARLDNLARNVMLSDEVRESLIRDKKVNAILGKGKDALDVGGDLKGLRDSWRQAEREGKEFSQWWGEPETTESLLRLDLKLLPKLAKKASPVGAIATGLETTVDVGYAVTAAVVYHDQLMAERELVEHLQSARVFQDVMADDWSRLNAGAEAAQAREEVIQRRRDQYVKMQKENKAHADRLRR